MGQTWTAPITRTVHSAVFGRASKKLDLPNPSLRWEKVEAWEAGAGPLAKKKTDLRSAGHQAPPGISNLSSIEEFGRGACLGWRDRMSDWNYNIGMNLATIKNTGPRAYSIIRQSELRGYPITGGRRLPDGTLLHPGRPSAT